MTAYAESYEGEESAFFEDFEMADEARLGFRPARRVSVSGAGVTSATLNTPKGPARLNLPAAVTTVTQFKQLESAFNAQTQRMNSMQAELVRMRRELIARRQDPMGGGGMSGLLFPMLMQKKLRDDFLGHSHTGDGVTPTIPPSTGGGLSSLLPLLLLSPGIFGGSSAAGSPASGTGQDSISPLLLMLVFQDL